MTFVSKKLRVAATVLGVITALSYPHCGNADASKIYSTNQTDEAATEATQPHQSNKATPSLISMANSNKPLPSFNPNWIERLTISTISFSDANSLEAASQITDVVLQESFPPTLYVRTASGSAYKVVLPSLADVKPFIKPDVNISVISPTMTEQSISTFVQILMGIAIFAAILAFAYSQNVKRIKTPGKQIKPDKASTRFEDIGGQEDAKESLKEMIELIKNPALLKAIGARPPKGAILRGPPGCGKTMLARAVATEAGMPFFNVPCSDIIDEYISVGAKRVKKIFAVARKHAPCVIFLDEVDAVATARGTSKTDASEERNAILTQILIEVDGIIPLGDIILIAATNRFHVLDDAITRYGRLERHIDVGTPTRDARHKIVEIEAKRIKIDPGVNMDQIERITIGMSGASLTGMLNEAALLAVRDKRTSVTMPDMIAARDRILMGSLVRDKVLSDEERLITAYHEGGHVVTSLHLPDTDPVDRATILPRGTTLGHVQRIPERDIVMITRNRMLSDLTITMGGRAAEVLEYGDNVTSGGSGDFDFATAYAKKYVMSDGLCQSIGPIRLIPGDYTTGQNWPSEKLNDLAADEVKKLTDEALKKAISILTENRAELDMIVYHLLEAETMSGAEISDLCLKLHDGRLRQPTKAEILKRLDETSSNARKEELISPSQPLLAA